MDKMLYEDLRMIHEDVERLEQAIADRVLEDPKHVSMLLISPTHATELTTHRSAVVSFATMRSQTSSPESSHSRNERCRYTATRKMRECRKCSP